MLTTGAVHSLGLPTERSTILVHAMFTYLVMMLSYFIYHVNCSFEVFCVNFSGEEKRSQPTRTTRYAKV